MIFILPSASQDKQKKLKLWYRQPALQWDHSMPIGNGRLGAMIFCGVQSEKIVLNEERIWRAMMGKILIVLMGLNMSGR